MPVWDKIEKLANYFEKTLAESADQEYDAGDQYDWYNKMYSGERFRRAHIEIVDNRESYGIYILHTTIFPHINDPSPIFGFDVICGKNKITGAFHDFSAAGDPSHEMMKWFGAQTLVLEWNKPRELPEWAKMIFSSSMVAAGNLKEDAEIDQLCKLAKTTLAYYLKNIGDTQRKTGDHSIEQNRYCYWQKQNPQVSRSMIAMGVPEAVIANFVKNVLFPEIS
jgi:phycocyanobilin:ferredoxin oxidoreductase